MRYSFIKTIGFRTLMLGLIIGILSGCVRPVDEESITATPDPNTTINTTPSAPTFTPIPPATPISSVQVNPGELPDGVQATDLPAIEAFILTQGHQISSGTLDVWQMLTLGDDFIIGFSYTNPSSLPCIGLVMADRDGSGLINVYNGDSSCATELGAPAIAGNWFLVTNNQPSQFLTATVGEVFNPSATVNSSSVIYDDGQEIVVENVQNNRFLMARGDSPASALRIIFINELGNIEAEVFLTP